MKKRVLLLLLIPVLGACARTDYVFRPDVKDGDKRVECGQVERDTFGWKHKYTDLGYYCRSSK